MYSKHVFRNLSMESVHSLTVVDITTGLKNTYGKHNETWIPKNTFTEPSLSHFKTVSLKSAFIFAVYLRILVVFISCSKDSKLFFLRAFTRYGDVCYVDERHRHRYEVGFSLMVVPLT